MMSQHDKWILDLDCTYHMYPHKEWLFNFEELNGGVVYMGNDESCKTPGVGSIRLKNHDGSTRVLIDVRYVPKLKKNLISLGALESKGFTMTIRDGILKDTSGSLVVMKGTRRNNLYYYNSSTVIGSLAVVSEDDKASEITRLWYMRLGHVGEKTFLVW
ncbi:hypothetical protein PanWU01x14_363580 [Parasponia andersonii]|uniref:Retrovirus-related Pol polyprotein from transposon TNT 1-94-like beta-barrel domain-containing protein n=1 Tax=Parasponia andersonii TaxID=3476 RepID=A0A2P5A6M7_PARAD|nr:hypothetical protein PanWU01x14_363580 [Parasponia andersonii]